VGASPGAGGAAPNQDSDWTLVGLNSGRGGAGGTGSGAPAGAAGNHGLVIIYSN
jgi:hypothetical protein